MTLPSHAMSQASFPETYEQHLVGPLFRPWAEALLERASPAPGDRVLDLACGTGIAARLARERVGAGGRVVGVDLSAGMLAVARRIEPGIEWREGDACAPPLEAGERFDLVLCQQGLQFFPDRAEAVRRMRGALAPGGRVAVATWRDEAENPLFRELHRVAERRLGPFADPRHGFGDAGLLADLLRGAGLSDVRVERLSRPVRFSDGSIFLRLNSMALVGSSPASKAMGEEERRRLAAAIEAESAGVLGRFRDGSALSFEMAANVATAKG